MATSWRVPRWQCHSPRLVTLMQRRHAHMRGCGACASVASMQVAAVGRPVAITPAAYKKIKAALDKLLRRAGGQKEVTVAMVKAESGCEASERVIRKAFHEHGIRFRKLREKPLLTPDDVKCRADFGRKHF